MLWGNRATSPQTERRRKMSTHALVGVRTSIDGFKAKFVHYDGYPSAMLPALNRVIKNHVTAGKQDLDPVAYILGNHWSCFNTSEHEPSQAHSHNQSWYTEANEIDHSYLYLIDRDTFKISVYIPTGEGWMEVNPDNVIQEKVSR